MKKTRLEMKLTALLIAGIVALQGPGQVLAAEEIFSDDSIVLFEEEEFLWNEVEEEGASEEGEQDSGETGGLTSGNADVSDQFNLIEDLEPETAEIQKVNIQVEKLSATGLIPLIYPKLPHPPTLLAYIPVKRPQA